jgi:hypothetical protein
MSFTVTYYIFTAVSPSTYVQASFTQSGDPGQTFTVQGYGGLADTNGNPSTTPTNTNFLGWGLSDPPANAYFTPGETVTFVDSSYTLYAYFQGRIGRGTAGTCFTGGTGSGGTLGGPITSGTDNAGPNGGIGTIGVDFTNPSQSRLLSGAGNPGGIGDGTADGTGGVLIIFVEGTITKEGPSPSTAKYFTADGVEGKQTQSFSTNDPACQPFGGGTGGGIVIVVNNDAASLTNNVQAAGGIIRANGPGGVDNFQSGGNGAAVAYTFSQL